MNTYLRLRLERLVVDGMSSQRHWAQVELDEQDRRDREDGIPTRGQRARRQAEARDRRQAEMDLAAELEWERTRPLTGAEIFEKCQAEKQAAHEAWLGSLNRIAPLRFGPELKPPRAPRCQFNPAQRHWWRADANEFFQAIPEPRKTNWIQNDEGRLMEFLLVGGALVDEQTRLWPTRDLTWSSVDDARDLRLRRWITRRPLGTNTLGIGTNYPPRTHWRR